MAIKSKADLEKLKDLPEEDRNDLISLFDSITTKDAEIARQKEEMTNANEVVKKSKGLEKLLKEKETLNSELQAKLDALTIKGTPTDDGITLGDFLPYSIFRSFLEESDDKSQK